MFELPLLAGRREDAQRSGPMARRGRRDLRPAADDIGDAEGQAGRRADGRRPLHHRRLLVHRLDVVRQSGGHHRARLLGHVRRHPPRRCPRLHRGPARRRGVRAAAGALALAPAHPRSTCDRRSPNLWSRNEQERLRRTPPAERRAGASANSCARQAGGGRAGDSQAAHPAALRLAARALVQPLPRFRGGATAGDLRRRNARLRSGRAAASGRRARHASEGAGAARSSRRGPKARSGARRSVTGR